MRLVDDEQPGFQVGQFGEHLVAGELLGGEEHEPRGPGPQFLARLLPRRRRHRGVQHHGAAAAGTAAHDGVDLVALQRDERGDHDDRSLQQQRGYLVNSRLPRPGRHHREDVAAGQDGTHGLFLARAQRLVPEHLLRRAEQVGRTPRVPGHGVGMPPLTLRTSPTT